MKDHILGSDEYLIRAQDTILQHLERFGSGPLQPIEDNQPEDNQEHRHEHADENLAVHDIHNGREQYETKSDSWHAAALSLFLLQNGGNDRHGLSHNASHSYRSTAKVYLNALFQHSV